MGLVNQVQSDHLRGQNREEATVPRYYFHLRTEAGLELDDTGIELPDIEAAYLEAWDAVLDIWVETERQGRHASNYAFQIADHSGSRIVMTVPFMEVLRAQRLRAAEDTLNEPMSRMRRLSDELALHMSETRQLVAKSKALLVRMREITERS